MLKNIVALALSLIVVSHMSVAQEQGRAGSADAVIAQLLEEIRILREQVEDLQERIATLEATASGSAVTSDDDGGADSDAESPQRIMQVESITLRPVDPASLMKANQRASELRGQATQKRTLAQSREKEKADLLTKPCAFWPHCQCANKDIHAKEEYRRKQRRNELTSQAIKLRQEAQKLDGEATRLEDAQSVTRHIVRGWGRQRTIILDTVRDCSGALSKVGKGGFIRWTGTLQNINDEIETWQATSITATERPSGFIGRSTTTPAANP